MTACRARVQSHHHDVFERPCRLPAVRDGLCRVHAPKPKRQRRSALRKKAMTIIVGKPLGDGSYTHQLPGTTPLERIVCGPRELRLEAELIFGGKFLRKRYWLFRRGKRPLIVCVFNVPQSS